MNNKIYYAGIGSRETPDDICEKMKKLGAKMATLGYTLNSGGAFGSDFSFEIGCDSVNGSKQIFLPWNNYNCHYVGSPGIICEIPTEAFSIAEEIHPAWGKCSPAAKKLLSRNVLQVLGRDLKTPVKMVICWTPNGDIIGGTAIAIRLAMKNNIKVWNLAINRNELSAL